MFRSSLMFTKLVSEAAGEPIRLVVLRRANSEGIYNSANADNKTYMNTVVNAAEQVSIAEMIDHQLKRVKIFDVISII